jgi:hypothetical protein
MKQQRKQGQKTTKGPPYIGPSQSDEERYKLLDLHIGLVLLGEEGRKQLLQYIKTLCKNDAEREHPLTVRCLIFTIYSSRFEGRRK